MPGQTILIQGESLGRGDEQLGKLLLANFLRLMGENAEKPARLILWNGGVRLACEGSPVLDHLKKLEGQGVEILACTTCLEYFDLAERLKVGHPTTMLKSIQTMLAGGLNCL